MSLPQNPHRCPSNDCILLLSTRPRGVGVSGPCRCLENANSAPENRVRFRAGIRWLAEQAGEFDKVTGSQSPPRKENCDTFRIDPRGGYGSLYWKCDSKPWEIFGTGNNREEALDNLASRVAELSVEDNARVRELVASGLPVHVFVPYHLSVMTLREVDVEGLEGFKRWTLTDSDGGVSVKSNWNWNW